MRIKEIVKKNYKLVIGLISGIVISGTTVFATTVLSSSEVGYNNISSGLSSTTVQDAIDEIYDKYEIVKNLSGLEVKTCNGSDCAKCIRATTLHKEMCKQTDSTKYCSASGYGYEEFVVYGNLGTNGILKSGDAFDCDVNGDKIYDAATERFYYVTDMDNETAVLIYYNNVSGGIPSNTTSYAYDANFNTYKNGPITAISQLPTTAQWNNVSLKNVIRDITDETGTLRKSGFSYEGYSARFLTFDEIKTACNIEDSTFHEGVLDECNYFLENLRYTLPELRIAYWLETVVSTSELESYHVISNGRTISIDATNYVGNDGVRPAIEVAKTDISY